MSQRYSTVDDILSSMDTTQALVRRWSVADLASHASMGRSTAMRRLIPGLVTAGVIARQGRFWYGRAADIDTYLLGRWSPPAAEGSVQS